jgi:centromere protein I
VQTADVLIAARIPAKQRESKVAGVVERVTARAYEVGVAPDVLEELVDLITTRNELDQASVNGLIRNLYPTEKVSDDIVIKVVCSLGHGTAKASFPAQAALLKWLVMVYDALENRRILSQLYAVLFNLLDTIAIRYDANLGLDSHKLAHNLQGSPLSSASAHHTAKACQAFQNSDAVSFPTVLCSCVH